MLLFVRGEELDIGRQVGAGGYGRVLMLKSVPSPLAALDLGAEYVIKVYDGVGKGKDKPLADHELRNRARLEATSVPVQHEGILLPVALTSSAPWGIVMEYWNGGSLYEYTYPSDPSDNPPKANPDHLAMFDKWFPHMLIVLASALAEVHDAGYTHNDLHSGNVLVSFRGCTMLHKKGENQKSPRVAITDWGVSSHRLDQKRVGYHQRPGQRALNIAPEHLLAPRATNAATGVLVEPSADVHRFGTMISRSLVGRLCLVTPLVAQVCTRCRSKTPSERPTMAEVRDIFLQELANT
jgi:serine/threonine protein kinase